MCLSITCAKQHSRECYIAVDIDGMSVPVLASELNFVDGVRVYMNVYATRWKEVL